MSKRSVQLDEETSKQSKRSKTTSAQASAPDMAAIKASKRILVLGLAGHAPGHPKPSPANLPRGKFRHQLQAVVSEGKKVGLELEMIQVKPSAFSTALQDIKRKLEAKPDGLVIGNGIRGTAEYTIFFEDLVNACREISPETRMAFNTSPDDIWECCERNFVVSGGEHSIK